MHNCNDAIRKNGNPGSARHNCYLWQTFDRPWADADSGPLSELLENSPAGLAPSLPLARYALLFQACIHPRRDAGHRQRIHFARERRSDSVHTGTVSEPGRQPVYGCELLVFLSRRLRRRAAQHSRSQRIGWLRHRVGSVRRFSGRWKQRSFVVFGLHRDELHLYVRRRCARCPADARGPGVDGHWVECSHAGTGDL